MSTPSINSYGSTFDNPLRTNQPQSARQLTVDELLTCKALFVSTSTTDATDYTGKTGSLQISGGASIAKSLYANTVFAQSGIKYTGGLNGDNATFKTLISDTVSCNTSFTAPTGQINGDLKCTGNISSVNTLSSVNLNFTGNMTGGSSTLNSLLVTNTITSNSLNDATSATTSNAGLYLPNSGAVIGKNLYAAKINTPVVSGDTVNSNVINTGSITATTATVNGQLTGQKSLFTDPTDATSNTSTNAAVCITNGGLAVANSIWGKTLNASTSISAASASFTNATIGNGTLTAQSVVINSTTDATSSTSPAAVTIPSGGISVANTIWGKNVNATNNISSATLTTSGSITCDTLSTNKSAAVNTTLTVGSTTTTSGQLLANNTTNALSSTSTSASIVCKGGAAFAQDVWCNTINSSNTTSTNTIAGLCSFGNTVSFNNTTDATTAATTAAVNVMGGINCSKTVLAPTFSISSVNTLTAALVNASSSQNGTASLTNSLRVRSSDSVNANVNVSIANNSMNNNYYESHLSLFSLGAAVSSTNVERLVFGVGQSGGYINHVVSGSGTTKPFNFLSGSVFTTGGSLNLSTGLDILGSADVNFTSPLSSSFYTAGGLYVAKGIYSNNATNAISSTNMTASISTVGGIAATKDIWSANMFANNVVSASTLMNTNMAYATYYVNSTQTISNRSMVSLAANLVLVNGNLITGSFATSSGSPNTYTALYSGLHFISLTIRITPTNAGTLEIIFSSGTNGSTLFPSATNRMAHTQNYIATGVQVALNCVYLGPMLQGDVMTPTLFYTGASGIGPTASTVTGTDCLYTAVCIMRSN